MRKTATIVVVWYEDATESDIKSEEFQVNGENGFALLSVPGSEETMELNLEPGDAHAFVNLLNSVFPMAQDVSDLE